MSSRVLRIFLCRIVNAAALSLLVLLAGSASTVAAQTLLHTFNDPTVTGGDEFGLTVAMDGNYVVIGAPRDNTHGNDIGQVHVYDATTGSLVRTFDDPTPTTVDFFGHRGLAVTGNLLLVGSRTDDTLAMDAGQAHLFDITTGSLLRTFDNPAPGVGDQFGVSVAMDGDHLLIGAYQDGGTGVNAGQAYLFDINNGSLLHTFDDPTATTEDAFGFSVDIEGNHVLISDHRDDTGGLNIGQAHLFDLSGALLQTFTTPPKRPRTTLDIR